MSASSGPDIVQDGLVFFVDYGVKRCYRGAGNTPTDLAGFSENLTINGFPLLSGDIGFTGEYLGGIARTGRNSPIVNTSSYINGSDIGLSSPLNMYTGGFTLECTFKPLGFATGTYFGLENVLLSKGPASTYNYSMQFNSSQLTFCKRTSPEGLLYSDISATFETGSIYHCALVINTGGDLVSGYQNGSLLGSAAVSTTNAIQPKADGTDPFYFPNAGGNNYEMNFQGVYYGAKVYNKALTTDEVKQNFNAIRSRYGL